MQEYKRQADWSFFPATPPLEALRSLLICKTIKEIANDVGQPVAWTEPVVLMLIDVRRALFYSAARRSVCGASCGSLHGQEQSWPFAQEHVWMQKRWSELGICVCHVIIAIGFVQFRTSPCIYRHLEKQLRVWVEGNDGVSLFYISNVKWFFSKLQELWVARIEESVGPPDIVTVCKAFVYWVGSSAYRTDGEIVRSDWSISLDTWSRRQAKRHRRSDRLGIQVGCRDLARNNATTVGSG